MKFIFKKCLECEKEFEVNIDTKIGQKQKFCSSLCSKKNTGKRNKGKKRTEEFKKKLSSLSKGKNNNFFGKKHSKDSIEKMKENSKWGKSKYKYLNMSNEEKEIFEGILISDGSLESSRISSRFTLGFKYKETLDRIRKDLPSFNFSRINEYTAKPHIKTGKCYTNYHMKSKMFHNLLVEYVKWYPEGRKIVPKDISITSLMAYWWYVCDGYLSVDNNVYLCTDSFDKESLEILVNRLNNFKVSIRSNNRLAFDKKSSVKFLKWISQDVEIQEEYKYKFKLLYESK